MRRDCTSTSGLNSAEMLRGCARLALGLGVLMVAQACAAQEPTAAVLQNQKPQAPQHETSQAAPIRVSVARVNVGVVVTDSGGKFAQGLRRENFHVFDNGVEQPITDFLAVEEPAQTLMLIEAGPAVYLVEGGHLQAARAFLNGLSADDRVAVVKYADSAQGLIDFTADKQSAAAAFEDLSFNLGFGSLNLSSSLAKVLDWITGVQGKKTIVLLSTGVDTSPEKDIRDLLQRLRTSDVRILAVSLTGNLRTPGTATGKKKAPSAKAAMTAEQFAEADMLLREIAEATGGQAYIPTNANELATIFAQVAQIVRHEFSLAFIPPVQDGAVHTLEVSLGADTANGGDAARAVPPETFSSYRVDYRRAYVAPKAANP